MKNSRISVTLNNSDTKVMHMICKKKGLIALWQAFATMEDRSKYKIKSLKILNDFLIEIAFKDGKIQKINFSEIEHKGWWKELEDLTYFQKVKISNIKHLKWPNGQDFKPEHLYYWEDYKKLYLKSV